jgi:hypothetical protein
MYDDVTVVPLSARMRTAPSRNPLVFKKVLPDGLCAPWAQLPYVPIGKLLTPKSLGRAVLASDTARDCKPAALRARSVINHVFMGVTT